MMIISVQKMKWDDLTKYQLYIYIYTLISLLVFI